MDRQSGVLQDCIEVGPIIGRLQQAREGIGRQHDGGQKPESHRALYAEDIGP
jgi:hypothetical protein